MSRVFVLILFFLITVKSFAQYAERIGTPRPGFTLGPATTGKNIFHMQTGQTFNGSNFSNSDDSNRGWSYLNSMRFGLTERLEARALFQFAGNTFSTGSEETKSSGLNALIVGARYLLVNNLGTNKPSLAIQVDANINVLSEDYEIDNLAPRILLQHGQNLTEKLSLNSNLGVQWTGNGGEPLGVYAVKLGFPLSDRWVGIIENYGSLANGDFDSRFDAGVGYFVTNHLKLDLAGGVGSNDDVFDYFVAFGFSIRNKR